MTLSRFPVLTVDSLPTPAVFSEYILYSQQSPPGSLTGNMSNRTLQTGVIYHPVHGYPIPPPVPVAVARRNARERNRVKTVNDSYQHLKNHVPGAARQKRMSKVDIIKHSIEYIQKLQKMVEHSEKASTQFPTIEPQQINNMQSETGPTVFSRQLYSEEYQYTNYNQNQSQHLTPSPSSSSSSSSSDSACSTSTSASSQLFSSYLSSLCSSYPDDTYSTNNSLVDDQLLEENILDVIAEWQDS